MYLMDMILGLRKYFFFPRLLACEFCCLVDGSSASSCSDVLGWSGCGRVGDEDPVEVSQHSDQQSLGPVRANPSATWADRIWAMNNMFAMLCGVTCKPWQGVGEEFSPV